jgi:hypothetical protein
MDVETPNLEQLLMIAAAVHEMTPGGTLGMANSYRVVNQVLRWRGLSQDQIRRGWAKLEDEAIRGQRHVEPCSPNEDVYSVLVKMVQEWQAYVPELKQEPLFQGMGNWGVRGNPAKPACLPYYNSCRLTARGEHVAQELLSRYPEYSKNVCSAKELK